MDDIIYCEVLHLATNTVWAFDHEVLPDSPECVAFQEMPTSTSAIFVRNYDPNPTTENEPTT